MSASAAAPAASTTSPLLAPAEVRTRLLDIEKELNDDFKERRSAIRAICLAMLAKEHCFILGRPGTGKSALIRAFFGRFTGAKYFEALLSKQRPPEKILGPLDIPKLRDYGDLEHKIDGYLPTANFALLDEVGKMGTTLGHDLLSVVLERRLHQVSGGQSWVDVPLYTFIGGSNELPTDENEDAAALWDRLLVRIEVDEIREASNWVAMLTGEIDQGGTEVDFQSLANVIDNEVPAVTVPANVTDILVQLRQTLMDQEIFPSSRRWKQSMKLLKASAWLDGRSAVEASDIGVLRYTLWETPMQVQPVERATMTVSDPMAETVLKLMEKADEIAEQVRDVTGLSTEKRAPRALEINSYLKELSTQHASAVQEAKSLGHPTTKLDEVGLKIAAVRTSILKDVLGLDNLA